MFVANHVSMYVWKQVCKYARKYASQFPQIYSMRAIRKSICICSHACPSVREKLESLIGDVGIGIGVLN